MSKNSITDSNVEVFVNIFIKWYLVAELYLYSLKELCGVLHKTFCCQRKRNVNECVSLVVWKYKRCSSMERVGLHFMLRTVINF
jgi:hypothetical protein